MKISREWPDGGTSPNQAPPVLEGDQDVLAARSFAQCLAKPLCRAFAAPSGLLGRLAGFAMARKNIPLNRFALELLEPQHGERVLEIGFGPGVALGMLAEAVGPQGRVSGVEVSGLMFAQAVARNAAAIATGRMRLALCSVSEADWPDQSFQRILSVSNVQFWRPATRCLGETFRMLRSGGVAVFAIHLQWPERARRTPGFFPEEVAAFKERLAAVGFTGIEEHRAPNGWDACIRASRSR
jgi:SAM-dependent methyltransferase